MSRFTATVALRWRFDGFIPGFFRWGICRSPLRRACLTWGVAVTPRRAAAPPKVAIPNAPRPGSVSALLRAGSISQPTDSMKEDAMRAPTPWTGMAGFKNEMDRLFERFLEPVWREAAPVGGGWEPKVDVSETKDTITVKAEVPGVEPKDIAISLQDGVLTIKGEKEEEKQEKDKHYHRVERSYGAFSRVMRLPAAVDGSKATAAFKDGLVTITLPKAPEAKGTTIPLKAAS